MSAIRSFRKRIIKNLTGVTAGRFMSNKEYSLAVQTQDNLPSDPLRHASFAQEVQRQLNMDRGGVSLAQAIREGQIQ